MPGWPHSVCEVRRSDCEDRYSIGPIRHADGRPCALPSTPVTYSIVAHDPDTGALGIAAQSHWLAVGATVTWGEAGTGVVATQSYTDPAYGPGGLALLRVGRGPQETLEALTSVDPYAARRQIAILDRDGRIAVHTGQQCIPAAGHRVADGVAAQANMMHAAGVWDAMVDAYLGHDAPLAERLVAALEAAEATGGDIRGAQSASIMVVQAARSGRSWSDTTMHLRIDDHPTPTSELARLVQLHRAYEHLHTGRTALEAGETDAALAAYRRAREAAPDNDELTFWHAVALAREGALDGAARLLGPIVAAGGWLELLRRLPASGLIDPGAVEELVGRLT
jgi:uncharacterized Ntn-hydrolase superfamily protein